MYDSRSDHPRGGTHWPMRERSRRDMSDCDVIADQVADLAPAPSAGLAAHGLRTAVRNRLAAEDALISRLAAQHGITRL